VSNASARLIRRDNELDLLVSQSVPHDIGVVWAALTEPERTARWYGPWEGKQAVGSTIRVQMLFEEGEPWSEMIITACNPPERLDLRTSYDEVSWTLQALLRVEGDGTEITIVHVGIDPAGIGDFGPGWEYYQDMLIASLTDAERPSFDDYYPARSAYYAELTPE
jgi:uncharacterized protein YndB with AHSA1/START domain